jgi:universal stress protein E
MAKPIRTVVAAVATLEASDPVLAPAIRLARQLDATLHLVHVYDLPEPIQDAYVRQMLIEPGRLQRYGDDLRVRLEALVRDRFDVARVVCHAVSGAVSKRVCQLAQEVGADLLVIGATRRGRIWRNFLGTSAEAVVRRASVPVLVVRHSLERPLHRVLLTTDLSRLSEQVHRRGVELVRSLSGGVEPDFRSLLVVHYEAPVPLPLRRNLLRDLAQQELAAFLKRCMEPEVPVEPSIRLGKPVNEILTEASEWPADLVVMGTHGQAGLNRVLLGSVAGATLREANCNVLVLPGCLETAGAQGTTERAEARAPAGAPWDGLAVAPPREPAEQGRVASLFG